MSFKKVVESLGIILFCGGCGTLSCLPIYYGTTYLYQGYHSLEWPSTQAKVIQSQQIKSPGRRVSDVSIEYKFRYTYQVNGQTYQSGRNSYKAADGDIANITDKLKTGDTTTIYYDPNNPENVVIEQGYSPLQILWIVAGLAGLTFSMALLWLNILSATTKKLGA